MEEHKYDFHWISGADKGGLISASFKQQCVDLYSHHYGVWSEHSPHGTPGASIKLSVTKFERDFLDKGADIYYAEFEGLLIAYAVVVTKDLGKKKYLTWITQLVVHEAHQNKGVGKSLLFSIWGFSRNFSWGLLTANPYAVRALEKATRRRCDPNFINQHKKEIIPFGVENISYINNDMKITISDEISKIDTKFFLDHSHLAEMVKNACKEDGAWLLGNLNEGEEWFAFTFNEQTQFSFSTEEINKMLEASDDIAKEAYSRMTLDGRHLWQRHAEYEVGFVVENCRLKEKATILDLGCGNGRHSTKLSERGFNVTASDYIKYQDLAPCENIKFIVADCRTHDFGSEFDCVLCLYDVIGSYVDQESNNKILDNIFRHLKSGGFALISVMSLKVTQANAKYTFSLEKKADELLKLPSSDTMQKSGDIFNPNYYLLDEETGVVYRREEFSGGKNQIPKELIVRDKRFGEAEIRGMCKKAGLKVVWSRFVLAGKWGDEDLLSNNSTNAKELLILCTKE